MRKVTRTSCTFAVVLAALLILVGNASPAAEPLDAKCSARSVDVSGDGKYAAVGWGMNVSVFRTSERQPLWTYATGGFVDSVVLSDDGQKLAVAYNDPPYPYGLSSRGHVAFFNISNPAPAWTYATDYAISGMGRRALDMTRDGSMIVAGTHVWPPISNVGTLYVFDTAHPIPPITYSYPNLILNVRISGNGQWFAAGTYWGDMRVYNVASGLQCTLGLGDPFYGVALDYDGTYVAAGHGWAQQVGLYRIADCSVVWTAFTNSTNSSLAMDDAGNYFVVSQYESTYGSANGVLLFHTSSNEPVWSHASGNELQWTVDMARNSEPITCGGSLGDVGVFGLNDSAPLFTQKIGDSVTEIATSADGSRTAGVSRDGFLYLLSTSGSETSVEWVWKTPCPTTLCHVPPENPVKARTIVVDGDAAAAHLMKHPDDYSGPCGESRERQVLEMETDAAQTSFNEF